MKVGDKVLYVGEFKAYVVGIRCNGIIIEFWGAYDRLRRIRVAARYLELR
jgi:hypothetical protein